MISTQVETAPSTPVRPGPPRLPQIEQHRSTRSLWWVWLILIVVLAAAGYFILPRLLHPAADPTAAARAARGGPVPVVAVRAVKGDMNVYLTGLGTVTAFNNVVVRTRVDGQIMKVAFTEGQIVKEGDPLVEIDQRPFQVQLTQAQGQLEKDQATLDNAKHDLERYQSIKSSITQQQIDTQAAVVAQSQGAVDVDKGQVDNANLQITYSHVTAPISGRIGLRTVDVGNIVHAADPNGLATIAQIQPIAVIFTVPEDQISEVFSRPEHGQGLSVEAYNRDMTKKIATGSLLAVDNQVDPTTGTVRIKAQFANTDGALFPNQFVNARLLVDTLKEVVIVPSAAVQRGPQSTFVYAVKSDDTVEMRNIVVGHVEGDQSVIENGVAPGDVLVTDGVDKLQQGSKVSRRKGGPDKSGRHAARRRKRPNHPTPPPGTGRRRRVSPSRPFILRPVATVLLMVAILLVGAVAYNQLPVSALPEVDYPIIQVLTFYPGASPDVMASSVTAPLERQFGQVPGLNQMTSNSTQGTSVVTLQFALELNIDVAEQEVQAAINAAGTFLPKDLPNPPIYSKTNPADAPILTLALSSKTLALSQVEDLADTRMAQKISQQAGVGLVSISGGQKPAVRIQANPTVLASLGMNLDDLRSSVASANVNQAKGSFDGAHQAYVIGANDQLLSSADYRSLVVKYRGGAPVILSDVASVVDGAENNMLAAWMNDTPAVIVNIQRQPGANIIDVVDRVKKLLPLLQTSLPSSVDVAILTDRTNTIRASVDDVKIEMLVTIVLVVLVIFFFLRTFAATVIPSVAVPLSLIGTFAVMYLLGYSLNNLTLMALTISTGFVVDDAIVMIENIARYIEAGSPPLEAALKGSEQIGFTIVSLSVSLIAVLIPLLFMGDVVGRLFREFAVTLSVTIVVSAIVSLTLTPMMCSKLLRHRPEAEQGRFYRLSERGFESVIGFYGRTLTFILRHQFATLLVAIGTLVATILLYVYVPKGFFPVQDTGVILGVSEAPQDVSFASMSKRQQTLVGVILKDPAVESLSSFIGPDGTNTTMNSGRIQINLKPIKELNLHWENFKHLLHFDGQYALYEGSRTEDASQVIRALQSKLNAVEGITLFMQPVQDLTVEDRVSRTQYQYSLEDPDPKELALWVPRLIEKLQSLPDLRDVASDQQNEGLQTRLVIDRDTASRLGITPQMVDDALYDAFGQRQISTIFTQLNQYHVVMEVKPQFQRRPQDLHDIYVRSVQGGATPLSAFTRIENEMSPLAVNHQGQFPVVTISFNLASGASLGQAVNEITQAKQELGLPLSIQADFQGTAEAFRASLTNEPLLILAALVTVYIVLGVLYESYIHPITILSTLPSAGVGALLALLICRTELSVIALIGIILLIGIVKKNAIMMIDFALEAERQEGKSSLDAIYEACLLRFRPIMMTTLAALLGGVPLALGSGTGSELRRPLGITIIGGLIFSQVLTLYTTPVIYLYFDRLAKYFGGRTSPGPGSETPPPPTGVEGATA